MKNLYTYITIFTTSILFFTSCTEPYEPKTGMLEESLVIESVITNELKKQTVKLSRVRKLESEFSNKENSAQVLVIANNETYTFTETASGIYQSNVAFKAMPNTEYTLFITLQNGKKYKSIPTFLTPEAPISNLYTQKETVNNQLGIQVFLDNNNIGNAKYFRYEFEETNKIVTPYAIYDDIFLTDVSPLPSPFSTFNIVVSPSSIEKRTCFATSNQEKIIQVNLGNSSEKNIIQFPVQFISSNNSVLRERYSILVKQYVQTFESYNYYNILNKLGNVESLLSEIQSGFVIGNVLSENNTYEKVVGFFEVASYSEKRIFFSYYEFNFTKPDYIYPTCTDVDANIEQVFDYRDNTALDGDPDERQYIYQYLFATFPPYEFINVVDINGQPTIVTLIPGECGNCSSFASNIRPDFWID